MTAPLPPLHKKDATGAEIGPIQAEWIRSLMRRAVREALERAAQKSEGYSGDSDFPGWGEMKNMSAADTAACEIADAIRAMLKEYSDD